MKVQKRVSQPPHAPFSQGTFCRPPKAEKEQISRSLCEENPWCPLFSSVGKLQGHTNGAWLRGSCFWAQNYRSHPVLPLTSVCLSVGEERASTLSFGQILSIRSCSIWRGVWYVGGVRERNRAPCSHWALRGHTSWLLFKHAVPKPPGPLLSLARGRAFAVATCAYLPLLIADPPVELFALQAQEILPRVDNATLDGNGPGCVDIVTSDHADCDPCPLALADGFWDLHKRVRAMQEGVTLAGSPCLQGVRATSSPR